MEAVPAVAVAVVEVVPVAAPVQVAAAVETAVLHIQINLANAELCYFHTGLVRDCILTFIMNFQIH